jgi:sugar diacid utilization regulator
VQKRVHLYSDTVVNKSVLSTMQRRKITAEVPEIHPNTLNYRLERIEALLGAKLDQASVGL